MATKKNLVRAGSRRGTQDKKAKPAEVRSGRLDEPSICDGCGAVFAQRVWRRKSRMSHAFIGGAKWVRCPACKQADSGEYWGRVVIRGKSAKKEATAIRQRIANVDARAQFTQPQRRVVSAEQSGAVFEVLTTSQKLAHRIVHELKKAFHGRASYKWSDDGSLYAVWEKD